MADWLWYFWIYSFAGYLLERAFALATHAPKQRRKCFLLLPLCPVYGLGVAAVLALPEPWRAWPWMLLTGAAVTTAVEYAVHWGYETFLGVAVWDYTGVPGNLNGRVCLPFTAAWGVLAAVGLRWLQPLLAQAVPKIPAAVTLAALVVFTADAVCSARYLWLTHDTEGLHPGSLLG